MFFIIIPRLKGIFTSLYKGKVEYLILLDWLEFTLFFILFINELDFVINWVNKMNQIVYFPACVYSRPSTFSVPATTKIPPSMRLASTQQNPKWRRQRKVPQNVLYSIDCSQRWRKSTEQTWDLPNGMTCWFIKSSSTDLVCTHFTKLSIVHRYVLIGKKANGSVTNSLTAADQNITIISNFNDDSSIKVTVPKVKPESIEIYKRYIETGVKGGFTPKLKDMEIYLRYSSHR